MNLLRNIFNLLVCFQLSSCSTESKTVLVDEKRAVSGGIVNASESGDLKVYFLSSEGKREEFQSFSIEDDKKNFSVSLEDQQILKIDQKTATDRMIGMGKELPSFASFLKADEDPTIIGGAWLELVELPEPESTIVQKILYAHSVFPVRKGDLLGNNNLGSSSEITLSEVGFAKLKVVDENNEPFPGVSVVVVAQGKTKEEKKAVTLPTYRPRAITSDANGVVSLFPLLISENLVNFKVVASKDGYCTFATPQVALAIDSNEIYEVRMKPCETDDNPGKFLASFSDETNVATIDDILVGYTGQKVVDIRIDALNQDLRGIEVSVIEGFESDAPPVETLEKFDLFTSDIEVPLPVVFSNTNTNNGDFLIKIVSIPTKPGDDENITLLYGKKSLDRPDAPSTFEEKTIVKSTNLSKNIISGREGGSFTVHSEDCKFGYEIGIKIDFNDTVFKPCVDDVGLFSNSDFDFASYEDGEVTDKKFKVFYRNLYGWENLDDPGGDNHIDVQLDYGIPVIPVDGANIKFGGQTEQIGWGIDVPGATMVFSRLGDYEENTYILTPSTLSDFVFRFGASGNCTTANTGFVGPNLSGLEIRRFSIFKESPVNWIDCYNSSDEVNEFTLNADSVFIPTESSDAYYYIMVEDHAGHKSEAVKVEIPPCPTFDGDGLPEGIILLGRCWRP